MAYLPTDETARRARAAIAYAGLVHHEVEAITGIKVWTLRRITERSKPREATLDELWAIADACGVPRSFMESGFADEPEAAPEERVEAVEHRLGTVERQLREQSMLLERAVGKLSDRERSLGERLAEITRESDEQKHIQAPPAKAPGRGASPRRRQGGGAAS